MFFFQKDKVGLVFEDLQFPKDFVDQGKRFNRIKSNFIWKAFLTLLERKCIEKGIPYKKVNPDFTSVIGKLKYKDLFNISIHESASFVIARRGLGYRETLSLCKYPLSLLKSIFTKNLVGNYGKYGWKSWGMWRKLRDNRGDILTELQSRMSGTSGFG
jgi:IS605 OrfB family transposase